MERLACDMRKLLLLFPLVGLCFSAVFSQAQSLKGTITDTEGRPVSYATVYIREIALGIVANEQGEFVSHLEQGRYVGEFSALGYEKQILPFTISDSETPLRITLQQKAYSLGEVFVDGRGEDPAYAIMRKAIAHAPFYRFQVKAYQADVYIKGTLKTGKLPSLGSVLIGEQKTKIKNLSNKLFLMESQNEVKFKAPNTYDQKVVALSSSIPAEFDDEKMAMNVVTSNVYAPELFGVTSPLAPGAFTYYKFVLEGVTTEGNRVINKIRVLPKKNNTQLVNGWLYILDGTWNLQHIDFTVKQMGVSLRNHVSFHEVKPDVWLPTAYDMSMKINMLGIKVEGKYYSSVQYRQVDVNEKQAQAAQPMLPVQSVLPATKRTTKKQLKARKKLEELAAKEELTTRDAYRMAQLMQDAAETPEIKEKRKSLQLQSWDSTVRITRDSLTLLRDTNYWKKIRTQPLQTDEVLSYRWKDSLKNEIRKENQSDSLKGRTFGKWMSALLMGEKIKLGKRARLGYGGLLRAVPEYNFVDGFWIGQRLTFEMDFTRKKPKGASGEVVISSSSNDLPLDRSITFSPEVYYTTARKALVWQVNTAFRYDPIRHGELELSGGDITEDYAGKNGTNRLINSFASLLFAANSTKLYRMRFADVTHRIDVTNGLRLSATMHYERRSTLENHTSYRIFGEAPHSNLPHGYTSVPMPDHTAWIAGIQLRYTPRYYYRIQEGRKIYAYSDYPTFSFYYRQGIPFGDTRNASFTMLSASVMQTVKLNLFNRFFYGVDAGIFPSAERLYLPDFKHFITRELYVVDRPMQTAFNLIDHYRYAANDKWLQGHLMFSSDYLLLKHIRFMQNYLFDEALHVHSLWIPGRNYSEAGYSVGFSEAGRIGVFAGFNNGRYDAVGFTVSLPLLQWLK